MCQPCTALTSSVIVFSDVQQAVINYQPSWHGEGGPICMALSQIPQTERIYSQLRNWQCLLSEGEMYTIPSCLYSVFQAKSYLIILVTDTTIP